MIYFTAPPPHSRPVEFTWLRKTMMMMMVVFWLIFKSPFRYHHFPHLFKDKVSLISFICCTHLKFILIERAPIMSNLLEFQPKLLKFQTQLGFFALKKMTWKNRKFFKFEISIFLAQQTFIGIDFSIQQMKPFFIKLGLKFWSTAFFSLVKRITDLTLS